MRLISTSRDLLDVANQTILAKVESLTYDILFTSIPDTTLEEIFFFSAKLLNLVADNASVSTSSLMEKGSYFRIHREL